MLARLLEVREAPARWLRVLLVGGQALGSALAERAIRAGWPLRVTYGMTETASQVATSDVLAEAPEPGFAGPILPGIRVSCETGSSGRIRVQGPVVMAGYANPERVPGDGLEDGSFVTGDLGRVSDNGCLVVLGRADDVLVIGGEAVCPRRVEEKLASAPGVESVVVVGIEHPVWGYRLVAAYTGCIGGDSLDLWCRRHLPARERPRDFRGLKQLPLLHSGKPDRRRILEMVTASPTPRSADAGAGTDERSAELRPPD
jgi:O-succinylbenzoic acid--CoA ligase